MKINKNFSRINKVLNKYCKNFSAEDTSDLIYDLLTNDPNYIMFDATTQTFRIHQNNDNTDQFIIVCNIKGKGSIPRCPLNSGEKKKLRLIAKKHPEYKKSLEQIKNLINSMYEEII